MINNEPSPTTPELPDSSKSEIWDKPSEAWVNAVQEDKDVIIINKKLWDDFKSKVGNMSYQGLVNVEDLAVIIGKLEDKKL